MGGRPLAGRPLFLRGLAGGQPCQPTLPAGELVAVFGGDGRAVLRNDVRDLLCVSFQKDREMGPGRDLFMK